MSRIRGLSIVAIVGISALLLTGCDQSGDTGSTAAPSETPTPTETASAPDPSKPDLEDLTLSTEGLGELQIGLTPPSDNPSLNLATFDPNACEAEGLPGIWTATYPDIDEGFGPQAPFAILTQGDALTRIDINTQQIYTDTGIHIGSSLDEVLGVYSGGPDEVVNHADVSDVYVIKGTNGQLQFEVAVDRIPDYWDASVIDTVVFLSAIDINAEPYGVAATDNGIGFCGTA
jgi:hypothetical protein